MGDSRTQTQARHPAGSRFPGSGSGAEHGRGQEVAGLIAEIMQRDVDARRASAEQQQKKRRIPVMMVLLVALIGFGTWNFIRITEPPVIPQAESEDAARASLYLIASSLDAYRTRFGRLPTSLAEAGLEKAGVSYSLQGGRYILVARYGAISVTLQDGQDRTMFARSLRAGGSR